jgi:hypothetical protein
VRVYIATFISDDDGSTSSFKDTGKQIPALRILLQFIHVKYHSTMAPGLVEATGSQTLSRPVKLSVFPDGFKTSGQHPPVYSQVRPYADFPKIHTGPTVWKPEDYREHPELWTHRFTADEVAEISHATDQFIQGGAPLTGISKV